MPIELYYNGSGFFEADGANGRGFRPVSRAVADQLLRDPAAAAVAEEAGTVTKVAAVVAAAKSKALIPADEVEENPEEEDPGETVTGVDALPGWHNAMPASKSSGGGMDATILAVLLVCLVVLFILLALVTYFCVKRRRKSKAASRAAAAANAASAKGRTAADPAKAAGSPKEVAPKAASSPVAVAPNKSVSADRVSSKPLMKAAVAMPPSSAATATYQVKFSSLLPRVQRGILETRKQSKLSSSDKSPP
jgi:hypothetical protein